MVTERKSKKGFTLIELLVVIAIIALLLSIVVPSLRRAREYAKKINCKSNLHQIALAIGSYESSTGFNFRTNDKWYFINGTGDMPYESQEPTFAKSLIQSDMLQNRQAFFCPGMRNVSYDQNYLRSRVLAGDTTSYNLGTIESMMMQPGFTDQPAFWSSFAWLWKKQIGTGNIQSINAASSGAIFSDVPSSVWKMAMAMGNQDATLLTNLFGAQSGIEQAVEHFNVLMKDLSVINPCDKDADAVRWLWNADTWAGM